MRTFEARAGKLMGQGPVLYNVHPQYTGTSITVPNGWGMGLYGWNATTGLTTDADWTVVDNGAYGPNGYVNLGN